MQEYQLPHYIVEANIGRQQIDYIWDDYQVVNCVDMDYGNEIVERVVDINWRGRMILLTGVYEWVLGCLQPVSQHPVFFKIAEAAYCALIDRKYLISFDEYDTEENSRNSFLGPVDGALWCAGFSAVISNFYIADDTFDIGRDDYSNDNVYTLDTCLSDVSFLIPLAVHIIPQDKVPIFKLWLEGVIERLLKFCTMPEDDPFANLFEYKSETVWLGEHISREILDLDYDYNPAEAVMLCDNYLKSVDYLHNPFLVSPEKLKDKIEVPYRLSEL